MSLSSEVFKAKNPSKRVLAFGSVTILFRHAADFDKITLIYDKKTTSLQIEKNETKGPVRLFLPLTDFSSSPRMIFTGSSQAQGLFDWATIAAEPEQNVFIYEKPLKALQFRNDDGVGPFVVQLPQPITDAEKMVYFCVQLSGLAGVATIDISLSIPDAAMPSATSNEEHGLIQRIRIQALSVRTELEKLEGLISELGAAEQQTTSATVIGEPIELRLPNKGSGDVSEKKSVNWIIGPAENLNWAYGNNARRLGGRLNEYQHSVGSAEKSDCAIYFDLIVSDRYRADAAIEILRIGGPRPLDRMFGDDGEALSVGLQRFAAVIPLNLALHRRVRIGSRRTYFIPNALDLAEWHPRKLARPKGHVFTVGFAASLNSSKEVEVKGFNFAKSAAEKAGVPLLLAQKGAATAVAPEKMITDFYSRCDVLLHPVAAGREGTSNVIMEALSCGVPVITTEDAGFHGELLVDRKNALIRSRDVGQLADAITLLKDDRKLRDRISVASRAFAERHHDVDIAVARYRLMLSDLFGGDEKKAYSISIVPFWTPTIEFGSSRLRALYIQEILSSMGFSVEIGYRSDSDAVIVVQMCDDDLMNILNNSEQFLIYDVCDRYFENPRQFKRGGKTISSIDRYEELMRRANAVIVPSLELKEEVSRRNPEKSVSFLPEPIDYRPVILEAKKEKTARVLWFGNPDRGNFESVRWMLDHLRDVHGYEIELVTRPSFFSDKSPYKVRATKWSPQAMSDAFATCSLCVVAHANEEQTKSPNRMIAAIMHGLPVLVSNSSSCEAILRRAGADDLIVRSPSDIDNALAALSDHGARQKLLGSVQDVISTMHSDAVVGQRYRSHFESVYFKSTRNRTNVCVVSHNLQPGEGAPRSLLETAVGLARDPSLSVIAFSAGEGELEAAYVAAGIPIVIFDRTVDHCVKSLNQRFADIRSIFQEFLRDNKIDVVLCNTVKSSAFAYFSREIGIPAAVVVRESFNPEQRFSAFRGEARLATEVGLTEAENIVFVAAESRTAWDDFPFQGRVQVIRNGIDVTRFASALSMTREAAREALGLPQDAFISLTVGSIGPRKNQGGLIEAFAAMPEKFVKASQLIILGHAESRHAGAFQAQLEAVRNSVGSAIRHEPYTANPGIWYRAADILLVNSSNEAYPRSVLEGLLFGLPVLSTRVFGVLSQVRHKESGLLYEIGDYSSWSEYLLELYGDRQLRDALSSGAKRAFWELTTNGEMVGAYRSVVGHSQALGEFRKRTDSN